LSELILVKLGGSIITDKLQAAVARTETIQRLATEVRTAQNVRGDLRLVLGHGSGSFGHMAGRRYGVGEGIPDGGDWRGYAETGAVAARLNRIVTDALLDAGVPAVSVQPSASARCSDGVLVSMEIYAVRQALARGLVPLVYGDVAFDDVRGCTIVSTEQVLSWLAKRLLPARIVLVGAVDGVHDRDPLQARGARRLPRITPASLPEVESLLGGSHGVDVTGGMLSKVRAMVSLVSEGAAERVHLVSGERSGALRRVLLDAEYAYGTVIVR
jgi:isopentenyl phosphate kinase